MSKEKQRRLAEINRPMNEELFNSIEKQYKEIARVKAESEQIEEMAEDLIACHTEFYDNAEIYTDYDETAKGMYAKGYRKQSEWISVKERLPETDKKVLVCYSNGSMDIAKYIRADGFEFWFEETTFRKHITHWMPLPEPPKGGAE